LHHCPTLNTKGAGCRLGEKQFTGLPVRDLQEALYFLLGDVVSRSAVNRITLRLQEELEAKSQTPVTATPPMLIVGGVWVDIQYTLTSSRLTAQATNANVRRCKNG
jgi:hypothetical protein